MHFRNSIPSFPFPLFLSGERDCWLRAANAQEAFLASMHGAFWRCRSKATGRQRGFARRAGFSTLATLLKDFHTPGRFSGRSLYLVLFVRVQRLSHGAVQQLGSLAPVDVA